MAAIIPSLPHSGIHYLGGSPLSGITFILLTPSSKPLDPQLVADFFHFMGLLTMLSIPTASTPEDCAWWCPLNSKCVNATACLCAQGFNSSSGEILTNGFQKCDGTGAWNGHTEIVGGGYRASRTLTTESSTEAFCQGLERGDRAGRYEGGGRSGLRD